MVKTCRSRRLSQLWHIVTSQQKLPYESPGSRVSKRKTVHVWYTSSPASLEPAIKATASPKHRIWCLSYEVSISQDKNTPVVTSRSNAHWVAICSEMEGLNCFSTFPNKGLDSKFCLLALLKNNYIHILVYKL